MSKDALAKVVQRAISDAAFRRQLNSDPTGALRGFDLSSDELSALRTGDAGRLSTLGIDQRMSKAFAIGGALASTRMSQTDLTPGGGPALVDDMSGAGGRTVIPSDPTRPGGSADIDPGAAGSRTARVGDDYKFASKDAAGGSGTSTVRAGDDWKFADRVAPESTSTVRVGDDWKFADRAASQGAVAPVEGSPEATAADIASGTRASAINDDPDGFLAANADAGGSVTRANVIHDDPNGFLAANANADATGSVRAINDDPDGFLAANADATGSTDAPTTAFVDESESYLTKVGYDSSVRQTQVTDAHERTYSGDDIAGPSTDSTSASEGTAADHHGDATPTP
jgi:hypothetical protein